MTFQTAPECAEGVWHYEGDGALMANVMHFRKVGGYDQSDLTNLAFSLDQVAGDDYLPLQHPGVTYLSSNVRGLQDIVDMSAVNSGSTGPGTSGTGTTSNNVTACFTLRSGFTGRSARGRFYAIGVPLLSLNSQNTIDSDYAADIVLMLGNLTTAIEASGWEWVILSRWSNKVLRPFAVPYRITDVVARNLAVDSQRGRLRPGH